MNHGKFYAPEDATFGAGDGGGSNANPTTLTYNYNGETITVDLSNPESVKLAQDRLSKGHNMEKIAEERNKLKKQAEQLQQTVDAWNARLEAAKSDPNEFDALLKDLETYIGKPLTRQEKQDLADAELDLDDPIAKKLLALERQVTTYQEQQKRAAEEAEVRAEAQKMIAKLDAMEKDSEHFPGFDREKVYEAARQAGTADFEMVYFWLNRDSLIKAEREKVEKEYKALTEKRKAAGAEGDATPAHLKETPKTFTRIEDVGRSLLEEIKAGKTSLFTE